MILVAGPGIAKDYYVAKLDRAGRPVVAAEWRGEALAEMRRAAKAYTPIETAIIVADRDLDEAAALAVDISTLYCTCSVVFSLFSRIVRLETRRSRDGALHDRLGPIYYPSELLFLLESLDRARFTIQN